MYYITELKAYGEYHQRTRETLEEGYDCYIDFIDKAEDIKGKVAVKLYSYDVMNKHKECIKSWERK